MIVWDMFNSSLEFGTFVQSTTDYVTGSYFVTLLFILFLLLAVAFFFKMPELLIILLLLPMIYVFSVVDTGFGVVWGIATLFVAYIIYQLIPIK